MRYLTLSAVAVTAILAFAFASRDGIVRAQGPHPAQIGIGSPLAVHVTNTPALPDGFTPGSSWRFTTWTSPSVITWTGQIRQVSGPWAQIQISADGQTTTRWYYVPAMPGSWEKH